MKEVVAKKYVKALISALNDDEFSAVSANLAALGTICAVAKMRAILSSPDVAAEKKVEFLLSLVENCAPKFQKFIKILGRHKRLEILPQIAKEFGYQKSIKNNVFVGQISGKFELNEIQKAKLEESFSKKFGSKISFERAKNEFNGIKIEIDDLGLEVSFSIDRLKSQMSEHILKAI